MHTLRALKIQFHFVKSAGLIFLVFVAGWPSRGNASESQSSSEVESTLGTASDQSSRSQRRGLDSTQSRPAFDVQRLEPSSRRLNEMVSRQYDVCTKHPNSYEEAFKNHPLANPRALDRGISPACTLSAMKLDRKSIRSCSSSSGAPREKGVEQCVGRRYHHVVHNALSLSLKCLNVNPAGVLPMFLGESGMRLNEVSDSGARGFGQLMPGTIDYLNKQKPIMLKTLEQSSDPACSHELAKLVQSERMPSSPTCAAVLPPSRVVLNIFYGIWHIREAELSMAETIYDHAIGLQLIKPSESVQAIERTIVGKSEAIAQAEKLSRRRSSQAQVTADASRIRELRAEINVLNQRRSELRALHVEANPELQRLLRVASVYGYNYGNGGFRRLLRMFLEDAVQEGPKDSMDLTKRLHAWLKENGEALIEKRAKREEALNHIEQLLPGGRGSEVTIAGKARQLNQVVRGVLGDNQVEAPCDNLYQ